MRVGRYGNILIWALETNKTLSDALRSQENKTVNLRPSPHIPVAILKSASLINPTKCKPYASATLLVNTLNPNISGSRISPNMSFQWLLWKTSKRYLREWWFYFTKSKGASNPRLRPSLDVSLPTLFGLAFRPAKPYPATAHCPLHPLQG